MSRRDLADLIGSTPCTIANTERPPSSAAHFHPSGKMLGKLAAALGCKIDDLFEVPEGDDV